MWNMHEEIISYFFGLKEDCPYNFTLFTFPVVRYFCGKGIGRTRTAHKGPAGE
jgi:hypothetical protein